MTREKAVRVEGVVREVLPSCVFVVELRRGERVLAHASSSLRLHAGRFIPGDRVTVEVTPCDLSRGRIVDHARRH